MARTGRAREAAGGRGAAFFVGHDRAEHIFIRGVFAHVYVGNSGGVERDLAKACLVSYRLLDTLSWWRRLD